jgi:hypothetical protein
MKADRGAYAFQTRPDLSTVRFVKAGPVHFLFEQALIWQLWQIKTTLTQPRGRAVRLRRLLADPQVSPAKLASVPMLIETAMATICETTTQT